MLHQMLNFKTLDGNVAGANGPVDQLDSGPVTPVRTSYQTHLHKNLQRLPSLRLPTDIPPGTSGPSTMRVHYYPTQAERQVVEEFRKGMKCDVILVDKDCFGKGSGVEMGKFLQEVRIKSPTIQPPPMVLLACKLEENEKNVQSLGFGGVLFKPIKPTVMLMLLTEVRRNTIMLAHNFEVPGKHDQKESIKECLCRVHRLKYRYIPLPFSHCLDSCQYYEVYYKSRNFPL